MRAVIDKVDWDCEIQKNYSETNLGNRRRGSSGLDWVFSEVEEAIIIEDDTVPHPSLFLYCQQLLDHYRDDDRVMHIGSANFQRGRNKTPYSYYFSRITHCWAWATWRRAWKHFDVNMATWPQNREMIANSYDDPIERAHLLDLFDQAYENRVDTWDYQWLYCCLMQSGLGITPNTNLVTNIGWGAESTHNTIEDHPAAYLPAEDIGELRHPPDVIIHRAADLYTFDHVWGFAEVRKAVPAAPLAPEPTPQPGKLTGLTSRMVESFRYRVIRGGRN